MRHTNDNDSAEELWKLLGVGASIWPPLRELPSMLYDSFTLHGKVGIAADYFSERQEGGAGYIWSEELISIYSSKPSTCGPYKSSVCQDVMDKYKELFVSGKIGLVVGSQNPWAEALLLTAGASHVVTAEYMPIISQHPQISTMHPDKLSFEMVETFDFAFSYSTFEHSGLGRYGDPINPFADLEAIARVHCLLKPGGVLFLGIPVGFDAVVWNAGRVYGKFRLSMLLQNWEVLDLMGVHHGLLDPVTFGYYNDQPILILRKISIS
jgi:hypothetical protein